MNKEELREKVREEREEEWLKEALRARKFSNINTFEQGLSLIEFALKMAENSSYNNGCRQNNQDGRAKKIRRISESE